MIPDARPMPAAPDADWRDLTLTLEELLRPLGRWLLVLAALTLGLHVVLWGWPSFGGLAAPTLIGTLVVYTVAFLGVYAVSAVAHELLHALAMIMWARVPWRSIRFGVRWREGIAYVHTAVPMTVRAYRRVLALPGVAQGLLPAALGLALGHGWLTFYGFVMLASSVGDYAMLRLLQPLDADALVRDHPTEIGCQVKTG